mgnify:CR=1 FL=1
MAAAPSYIWRVRGRDLNLSERTLVMGVLNVTPDSFSDGGQFRSMEDAVAAGERLAADGADIVDVGGESTRPGRPETVNAEEEVARVIPVITELRRRLPEGVLISVDTYKSEVARQALEAGADIINDIYALRRSPEIADLVARHQAGLILMHMQGDPETMQQAPRYRNVLVEIRDFLRERLEFAKGRGVAEESVVVDPGIGFGKTIDHNVEILAGLEYLRLMQRPICIGASRKGFLGKLIAGPFAEPVPVDQREEATVAAHCVAVLQGAAIVRTHNPLAASRSLAVVDAIRAKM